MGERDEGAEHPPLLVPCMPATPPSVVVPTSGKYYAMSQDVLNFVLPTFILFSLCDNGNYLSLLVVP